MVTFVKPPGKLAVWFSSSSGVGRSMIYSHEESAFPFSSLRLPSAACVSVARKLPSS